MEFAISTCKLVGYLLGVTIAFGSWLLPNLAVLAVLGALAFGFRMQHG
jgi:hypothetical protein